MGKVYALIDYGWDSISDSGSESENCVGIFTSSELVTKAANDYLKNRLERAGIDKECFIIPETPLTFNQLEHGGYEYLNHTDYYGASLYVYIYELDKYEF